MFRTCSKQLFLPMQGSSQIVLHVACSSSQNAANAAICFTGIGTFQSRTPDIPYTLVPGDVASSIIVASMAATAAGQGNQEGPNITQACTSCSNPLTLRQLTDAICKYYRLTTSCTAPGSHCCSA